MTFIFSFLQRYKNYYNLVIITNYSIKIILFPE
jgi:hypothetical protein